MSHAFVPLDPSATRAAQWEALMPSLQALVAGEPDVVANLANVASALWHAFAEQGWHWVGFYRQEADGTLVLGPFHGPPACTRLRPGRGVCQAAVALGQPLRVDDVDAFPGHIACSSLARSELVVPFTAAGQVWVLDVDHTAVAGLGADDQAACVALCAQLQAQHS